MRRALQLLLLLCLCAAPATARADRSDLFFFPGLTTGASLLHTDLDTPGWFIGAEVSAMYVPGGFNILNTSSEVFAVGAYIDALRDLGAESTRVSLGPELVWEIFGIDGGYLLQLHDGQLGHGITGRLFISLAVPSLFIRGGKTWGPVNDTFMEIGLTLKLPLIPHLFD